MWTFGKKVGLGFALSFVLVVIIGGVAYRSVSALTQTSYLVTHTHEVLEHISRLLSLAKDAETGQRGFVITGDEAFLQPYQEAVAAIDEVKRALRQLTRDNPDQQQRMEDVDAVVARELSELARSIAMRRSVGFAETARVISGGEGKRVMDSLRGALGRMEHDERELLKSRAEEVESTASGTKTTIWVGTLLALILVVAVAASIVRSLSLQIGSAVRHVQSSSAELQAAASQQVTSAKEQATAMTEITTTLTELVATSRQIADSAQRVAKISNDTASAARIGDETVVRTQEAVGSIKRQVDAIVGHMIELGKKSQQIGGILEIINELSEQTNILAINATIEAAGAGESGKRFAVVADEIRKLADRVGASTKDIRGLVDDIRAAVNTTVMVTEGGSKAVARQFGEVAMSFRQIAGMVSTTTDAAKEIELGTKQQTSAVEQVNLAVVSVSQAARETEASSGETLQASSELITLSRALARLIQPQA